MTIVRSLRVVIEMPNIKTGSLDREIQWLENVFRAIGAEGGKIGSWGIMEEEID